MTIPKYVCEAPGTTLARADASGSGRPPVIEVGVFRFNGYKVSITVIGDRTWARRLEEPTRFATPLHLLVYRLRTLLGLEGGKTWTLGERDSSQAISMAWGHLRAFPPTEQPGVAADKRLCGDDQQQEPLASRRFQPACMEVQRQDGQVEPVPARYSAQLASLSADWLRTIAALLSPEDRLNLGLAAKGFAMALGDQLTWDRAVKRTDAVRTLSNVLECIDAVQNPPASARQTEQMQARMLVALANRLPKLCERQYATAWRAILRAVRRVDGAASAPQALEALARQARRYSRVALLSPSSLGPLELALFRLPPKASAVGRLELIRAGLSTELKHLSARAQTVARYWLALVQVLPADGRQKAVKHILSAVNVHRPQDYVTAWNAMCDAVSTLEPRDSRLCGSVLAALAETASGAPDMVQRYGRQVPEEVCTAAYRRLIREAASLPRGQAYVVAHALATQSWNDDNAKVLWGLRDEMAAWAGAAGFTVAQVIRLRASMISAQPEQEREAAWQTAWDGAQREGPACMATVVAELWRVPGLAGWSHVLKACDDDSRLPAADRAELLMLLHRVLKTATGRVGMPGQRDIFALALRLAVDHGELKPVLAWAGAFGRDDYVRARQLLKQLPLDEQAVRMAGWLPGGAGALRHHLDPALALAEDPALSAHARALLLEAVADRCNAIVLSKEATSPDLLGFASRLLGNATDMQGAVPPGVLAVMARLGNSMTLVVDPSGSHAFFPHVAALVRDFVDGTWRLASQLTPPALKTMFDRLLADMRPPPGFHDERRLTQCWSVGTMLWAATASLRAPAAYRAGILEELISAEYRLAGMHRHSGFDQTRALLWKAVRTVPAAHRAIVLSAAADWFSTPARKRQERHAWHAAREEYLALRETVPGPDRPLLPAPIASGTVAPQGDRSGMHYGAE